jgi:hypothetical protein
MKVVQQADFIVPVEIEYHWHHFHVLKRPGVDHFLKKMGEIYEVVVFTASLSKVCILNENSPDPVGPHKFNSMPTQYLISSIFTKWSHTDYSGRVVSATKEIMSRLALISL